MLSPPGILKLLIPEFYYTFPLLLLFLALLLLLLFPLPLLFTFWCWFPELFWG